ncbi:MAG: hypothetical protein ABI629_13960 [bacterium]
MSATARERLAALNLPGTVRFGAMPVEAVRRLPTGLALLDALLGGGLPRGHLSEIVGATSSGRTSVLHALLAAATRDGEAAALVDLPAALDPASLAAAGAQLDRILWVRPPSAPMALKCAELILGAGGFALVALDLDPGPRASRAAVEAPRGNTPPRRLSRATWPRLAQAARGAGAVALILSQRRLADGVAAVAIQLTQHDARWGERLFEGLTTNATLTRSRFSPAEKSQQLILGEQLTALDGVVIRSPGKGSNQWERKGQAGRGSGRVASG